MLQRTGRKYELPLPAGAPSIPEAEADDELASDDKDEEVGVKPPTEDEPNESDDGDKAEESVAEDPEKPVALDEPNASLADALSVGDEASLAEISLAEASLEEASLEAASLEEAVASDSVDPVAESVAEATEESLSEEEASEELESSAPVALAVLTSPLDELSSAPEV